MVLLAITGEHSARVVLRTRESFIFDRRAVPARNMCSSDAEDKVCVQQETMYVIIFALAHGSDKFIRLMSTIRRLLLRSAYCFLRRPCTNNALAHTRTGCSISIQKKTMFINRSVGTLSTR